MFIKDTVFKKLLKKAHTSGFIIGNNSGEVFINAGSWAISVKEKEIPNKIKANIIELTGEIPAAGEVFSSMKDCARGSSPENMKPETEIRVLFCTLDDAPLVRLNDGVSAWSECSESA